MKLIQQAMEDHYEGLVDNEGTHDLSDFQRAVSDGVELEDMASDVASYEAAKRIENTLSSKVNRGEDLTDEEIYIAVETIGSLYSNSREGFTGFGFESYQDKNLDQKQKSRIALEAITNQNADKAKTIKAKLENFGNGVSNYFSWFTGSMAKLRSDANDVLARVRDADETDFKSGEVTDKRTLLALQRGYKTKPFNNYKDVLKALEGLIDSLKILSSASKYESLGSGEGSKYDLAKLVTDMNSRVIHKAEGTVTYDLNPDKLTGAILTARIPDNSDNNYLMRNLKANFVVQFNHDMWNLTEKAGSGAVRSLSKKECIQLLEDVIKHIDEQERTFRIYYKAAKLGITDILKGVGKTLLLGLVGGYNSLIFRGRVQDINTKIVYMNNAVLRGMIAWAASSIK